MREALMTGWEEVGGKIVGLAEAVPEAAYGRRAVPGTRTVAEQLRHVAFWNDWLRDTLRGLAPDGAANELPADAYPDKAAILGALRAGFGAVRDAAAEREACDGPAALGPLVSFLAHAGEHYGQLVVHARRAGVVPPASREG